MFLYQPEDDKVVIEECISQTGRLGRWFLSWYNVMAVVASSFPGIFCILDADLLS